MTRATLTKHMAMSAKTNSIASTKRTSSTAPSDHLGDLLRRVPGADDENRVSKSDRPHAELRVAIGHVEARRVVDADVQGDEDDEQSGEDGGADHLRPTLRSCASTRRGS